MTRHLAQMHQPIHIPTLSDRQMDVARLVHAGHADKEIARTLGISHRTVSNHVLAARSELNLPSRVALAVWVERRDRLPATEGT